MKKLFAACHNYGKTQDGSYFKTLREAAACTQAGFFSQYTRVGYDWRPAAEEVDALETGKFDTWYPELAQMTVHALALWVVKYNGAVYLEIIPPEMHKELEQEIRKRCRLLGFKFASFARSKGTRRYRITDIASGLFYSDTDFRMIAAVVDAATKEVLAAEAASVAPEKKIEIFDPFEL